MTVNEHRIACDAFILIGGRSSRLGRDKAFVSLAGRTFLDRAVSAIRDGLGDGRIIAVTGADSPKPAVEISWIRDIHADRGPVGGLHAALSNAKSPWILLLGCDLPFVSGRLISLLASRINSLNPTCAAIVPVQTDDRLQPLCGFYKVEAALPVVEKAMERREAPAMHEVVARLEPLLVRSSEFKDVNEDVDPFLNVNTETDLDTARKLL